VAAKMVNFIPRGVDTTITYA